MIDRNSRLKKKGTADPECKLSEIKDFKLWQWQGMVLMPIHTTARDVLF